jgi:hypothetical protein
MKSFSHFLKEDQAQAAGFVRHYALTQKERHNLKKTAIERNVVQIQDICNVGLQHDDLRAKMDQILLAFFYLAQTIRYEGELSAATINATLTHFLAPNEIHAKLERYPKPDDLSFRSDEPAIKKSEKG